MKRLVFTIASILSISMAYSQVEQLVYLNNGDMLRVEYIEQDENTLTVVKIPVKKNDPMIINKDEVLKTQTLGVRFLDDEYTHFLAQGVRKLEFQKLCHTSSYGVHLSCREINDTLALLIKIKFPSVPKNEVSSAIQDRDVLRLVLESGEVVELIIHDTYILRAYVLYNFGVIKLTPEEVDKLISTPIDQTFIGSKICDMNDGFCIMRQVLALMDN